MTDALNITLVQTSLDWENIAANLQSFDELLSSELETDLVILPEMFTTGFSMNAEALAESMDGEAVKWMRKKAAELDAAVVGSLIIEDGGKHFNRLVWMQPNGEHSHYDKRHLFSFAEEDNYYSAGSERLIVDYHGWKICPLICYDLRFPVWSRNQDLSGKTVDSEYDVLIYVANWPKARRRPWINLLEARAHENQAFVAGVNRVGVDGNGIEYSGDSGLYSPKGELLSNLAEGSAGIETITIHLSDLNAFREKFGAWKDKDSFTLQ